MGGASRKDGEKTYDGLEELGRVSGLGREEAAKIFEEVKANHARLDACAGPHDFVPHEHSGSLAVNWRCTKCQGILASVSKYWYEDGLKHGRKERDDRAEKT